MLQCMDRSLTHHLKQKGYTNTQIAKVIGCHRDSVARVLRESPDKQPAQRERPSQVAVFHDQIQTWLNQNFSVKRMIERARADADHPYQGRDPAFYAYVRPLRRKRRALDSEATVRFEGLPGELLQIDWGEVRRMPFTKPALEGQTRYFFAARLKHSRWMFVRFTRDMREETLIRCLIACFVELGGVPWVVTTDNMKTVTLGRDERNHPIWHPTFRKFAVEFGFHPDACSLRAGNQKGSVENLVKFVKQHFLVGRSFYDDTDLEATCAIWRQQANQKRPSQATEQSPLALLVQEQEYFGALPPQAHDYGLFEIVHVTRESVVHLATNRYSVPTHLVGTALTLRIHPTHLALYQDDTLVATHRRCFERNMRIMEPAHFETIFQRKPRARVMVYRDWLVGLDNTVAAYVSALCRFVEQSGALIVIGASGLGKTHPGHRGGDKDGAIGLWRAFLDGAADGEPGADGPRCGGAVEAAPELDTVRSADPG